jgi:hypothetical protein
VDDADIENAERQDVHAPPEGDQDDDSSWPVLSDLDLAVCLVDHVRTDARSPFPPLQST